MKKLLKYELRNIAGVLVPMLTFLVALNGLVLIGQLVQGTPDHSLQISNSGNGFSVVSQGLLALGMCFSWLINFSAPIVIFIYGIELIRKDLNSDTGMLTFSLPKRASEILGAKLGIALFSFVSICAVTVTASVLQIGWFISAAQKQEMMSFLGNPQTVVGLAAVVAFLGIYIFCWLMIVSYFSIVVSNTVLKGRKIRWLMTGGLFIAISAMAVFVESLIEKIIPGSFDLVSLMGEKLQKIFDSGISFNYASTVFDLGLMAVLFWGMSRLTDYKMDL